jgi:hypothetical protein
MTPFRIKVYAVETSETFLLPISLSWHRERERERVCVRACARVCVCVCVEKGKAVPLQAWSGPEGSRKLGSQIS